MERFKRRDEVGILIKMIDNRIVKAINKNLTRFNLTATQEKVMWIIFRGHKKGIDVFQKDIEREMDLSNPTITGIVKRLEEKELIIRIPSCEDARYKSLKLTDKGMSIIHECRNFGVNNIEKRLIRDISEEDIKTLKTLLNRVLDNIDD